VKETNKALNENKEQCYRIPDDPKAVAQELLLFENSGSDDLDDFVDFGRRISRLTAKLPFQDAMLYRDFFHHAVEYLDRLFPDASVTITGLSAVLFRIVVNAIDSIAKSYVSVFIVVSALMVLLIGDVRLGLLSMVPNLAPIFVAMGLLGWIGPGMNLFTMLTGNIAVGLAVDDTIHFMHNFRKYRETFGDTRRAVIETLDTAGRAMLITSLVLSAGFFTFMFADLNNLFYFGLMTGSVILLALAADFFVAPALVVLFYRKSGESIHIQTGGNAP
jgi:predicted RND superfamily exporter protein